MCGKSMLGSLYLSILLMSCLSFDFGSANSSEEEIEECTTNSDCLSAACDTKTNRCYELLEFGTWCGDAGDIHNITIYEDHNEAIEACNDDLLCTCIDYANNNYYWNIIGQSVIEPKDGWTALVKT